MPPVVINHIDMEVAHNAVVNGIVETLCGEELKGFCNKEITTKDLQPYSDAVHTSKITEHGPSADVILNPVVYIQYNSKNNITWDKYTLNIVAKADPYADDGTVICEVSLELVETSNSNKLIINSSAVRNTLHICKDNNTNNTAIDHWFRGTIKDVITLASKIYKLNREVI